MKAVAFQCIYCISHELSAANKDLSLNKYLQHQHWDLSWQVKFPSKSLAIAQQIPEGRNLGILAEPIVTREGKHSRERAFMKRMHVLLFTGIGILCEVTRTLSRQYWACLGFFFLPPPPPPPPEGGYREILKTNCALSPERYNKITVLFNTDLCSSTSTAKSSLLCLGSQGRDMRPGGEQQSKVHTP